MHTIVSITCACAADPAIEATTNLEESALKIGDTLKQHFTRYCGDPVESFAFDGSNTLVQRFENVPSDGLSYLATIGLSATILRQVEGNDIRHELGMTIASEKVGSAPKVLVATATVIADERRALRYGQVIGPFEGMFPEIPRSRCTYLYCSVPSLMPEEFSVIKNTTPPIIIAELYPITEAERVAIDTGGVEAFESLVESGQVDLLDLERG
jgi:hypothetical protein